MESILEAIGNTPLVRLRRCTPANGAELWLNEARVLLVEALLQTPEAIIEEVHAAAVWVGWSDIRTPFVACAVWTNSRAGDGHDQVKSREVV